MNKFVKVTAFMSDYDNYNIKRDSKFNPFSEMFFPIGKKESLIIRIDSTLLKDDI